MCMHYLTEVIPLCGQEGCKVICLDCCETIAVFGPGDGTESLADQVQEFNQLTIDDLNTLLDLECAKMTPELPEMEVPW